MWPLASFTTAMRTFFVNGLSRIALYGVSLISLPAYLFSSGLGSKLSRCEVPPTMNSQMTRLALGAKCGRPSGGRAVAPTEDARATRPDGADRPAPPR